jgi:transcription elongation GreA/GreB family factor
MMQREMDKLHASIDTYQNQLLKLQTLVGIKSFEIIGVGSLIETNFEKYYISIGLGEITCSSEKVFSISSASPIGELLMGKKLGEYIELCGRKIIIKNIS